MAVIVCRGCGQRHDALARCPVAITTGSLVSEEFVPPVARQKERPKVDEVTTLPKALMLSEVARQKKVPKVDEVSTLPKLARLAKAREVLEGDCSNPACPYRPEVMRMREQNRKRNEKWRMKQGTKPHAKSGKVGT